MGDRGPSAADGDGLTLAALQHRALKGASWTAASAVIGVPLGIVTTVLTARALGAEEFGRLAIITATLALAFQLLNFGFSGAIIQWGAAALAAPNGRPEAASLLRKTLGFHLLIEYPLLLATTAIFLDGDYVSVRFAVLAIGLFLTMAASAAVLGTNVANRTDVNAKISIVSSAAALLASLAVALTTKDAVLIWATRQLVAAAFTPLFLLPLPRDLRAAALRPAMPRELPAGFWRFAFLSAVAAVLGTLVFSRSEIFLLQLLGSATDVGAFALAYGLSYQMVGPINALLSPLLPAAASILAMHGRHTTRAFLRAFRLSSLAAGLLLVLLGPVVVSAIPLLYGDEFGSAAQYVIPLMVVSCLQASSQPVVAFVTARREGGLLVRSNAVALLLNVAVAVPAILTFGVWGAVVGNAVGQLTILAYLTEVERRRQSMPGRQVLTALAWFLLPAAVFLVAVLVTGALGLATGPTTGAVQIAIGLVMLLTIFRLSSLRLPVGDIDALQRALPARMAAPVGRMLRPLVATGTS